MANFETAKKKRTLKIEHNVISELIENLNKFDSNNNKSIAKNHTNILPLFKGKHLEDKG